MVVPIWQQEGQILGNCVYKDGSIAKIAQEYAVSYSAHLPEEASYHTL